jgi:putative SOS response-associated peptidase YedK
VADVAGVPEMQLSRVVRLTATAGFLREPRPGYIEHTPLSAPFVTKLSYFDAAMFIAETAAPAAMQMAAATRHQEQSTNGATRSPFMLTSDTLQTFQTAHDQRPKLQRQWSAYLMCTGDCEDGVTEILRRLDWPSLGTACVVDVSLSFRRNCAYFVANNTQAVSWF